MIEVSYEITLENPSLLDALTYVKTNIDPTLTFSSGCRSEVCGSCSMRVNGKEELACGYKIQDGDVITPLNSIEIIKDLVVSSDGVFAALKKTQAYMHEKATTKQSAENVELIETQSDCILCNSCYSACPVVVVNKNFIAPFAYSRVSRYSLDERSGDSKHMIDAIQKDGIWDCTLCGECTTACPQGLDPKMDILNLRAKSGLYGYMDSNFSSGGFYGGLSF